jgi:hypothetical protein
LKGGRVYIEYFRFTDPEMAKVAYIFFTAKIQNFVSILKIIQKNKNNNTVGDNLQL